MDGAGCREARRRDIDLARGSITAPVAPPVIPASFFSPLAVDLFLVGAIAFPFTLDPAGTILVLFLVVTPGMTVTPLAHPLALALLLVAAVAFLLALDLAGAVPVFLLVFALALRAMIAMVLVTIYTIERAR
jgi:hypothetical protein